MRAQSVVVGFAGVALACSETSADFTASNRQAVLYGQLSGHDDDAVIRLQSKSASGILWNCSGALVAPNVVLTARHCVADYSEAKFTCDSNGNLVSGSTPSAGQTGTLDQASDVAVQAGIGPSLTVVAHGASIFAAQTTTVCRNDIVLIVLDREVTSLPIVPMRLFTETTPGEPIRVVGYGTDQDGGLGVRHTRSGITIAEVGSSQLRPNGDPIPPRTFMTVGPLLCDGDSGGPAFSDNDAVIGVFSQYVGNSCSDSNATNYFTELAPFTNDIVLPAFAAAGAVPWLESNSEPGLYGAGGATTATGGNANGAGGGSNAAGGTATTGGTSSTGGQDGSGGVSTGGASAATGGDTSAAIIYDQAPANGGSCACRTTGITSRGFTVFVAAFGLLGLRRRR